MYRRLTTTDAVINRIEGPRGRFVLSFSATYV